MMLDNQFADNTKPPVLITADKLDAGKSGVIVGYNDSSKNTVIGQLQRLGLVAGARIRLNRAGPFGDPLDFSVRGYRLALRKEEAAYLRLIPE